MNKNVFLYSLLILFIACGGGGGSTTPAPPVPPVPPTVTESLDDICASYGWGLFCEFTHKDLEREFTVYIPQTYSHSQQVPLLFNFHGYGSNAYSQIGYGDFRNLAEEQNFIIVIPQGSLLEGTTHWNVESWTSASTTDDIDFTSTIIDKISAEYSIDLSRVYSTGMSNGGFMSYFLACFLSDEIAAIASVTGSMSQNVMNNCSPSHPTPIMQIHGTSDSVVPYISSSPWTKSLEEVAQYWASFNNCTSDTESIIQDANSDGKSGKLIHYSNCSNQVDVQLYEMTEMGHIWPEIRRGDDIDGAEVIWNFLSQYNLSGKISN